MAAEAVQGDPRGQRRRDQPAHGVGHHDLAAVRRGGDAGGPVHVDPDEPGGRGRRLAGMDAHPDVDLDARGPGLVGERALCFDGSADRLDRAVEDNEERIADFEKAMSLLGEAYELKIWCDAHSMRAECEEFFPTAALVSPGSASDLASAIESIAQNPRLLDQKRVNSPMSEAFSSVEDHVKTLQSIYSQLAG